MRRALDTGDTEETPDSEPRRRWQPGGLAALATALVVTAAIASWVGLRTPVPPPGSPVVFRETATVPDVRAGVYRAEAERPRPRPVITVTDPQGVRWVLTAGVADEWLPAGSSVVVTGGREP